MRIVRVLVENFGQTQTPTLMAFAADIVISTSGYPQVCALPKCHVPGQIIKKMTVIWVLCDFGNGQVLSYGSCCLSVI